MLDEALGVGEFLTTPVAGTAVNSPIQFLNLLLEMLKSQVLQKIFQIFALISMFIKHFLPITDAWTYKLEVSVGGNQPY
jgi:hypothetical protein